MSDSDLTIRILREIQSELADMRDDRTVMISILNRHDSSIDGLSAELRALRSQLDRFRTEMRAQLSEMRERLSRIEDALQTMAGSGS
jgi:vacuolar-type H+-ATPase subunit I/STV1